MFHRDRNRYSFVPRAAIFATLILLLMSFVARYTLEEQRKPLQTVITTCDGRTFHLETERR